MLEKKGSLLAARISQIIGEESRKLKEEVCSNIFEVKREISAEESILLERFKKKERLITRLYG